MLIKTYLFSAALAFCVCGSAVAEEDGSGAEQPKALGGNAELLLRKVSMHMTNTPLGGALEFHAVIGNVKIIPSQSVGNRTVTLVAKNVTLAEALSEPTIKS